MKFKVYMEEVYSNDIIVEAESKEDAERIAAEMYEGGLNMFFDGLHRCDAEPYEGEV